MSFINPLFLIAGSAVLLPIIYHLIRKLRARKVRFSSLLFFKATPKELIRKRKLQDLILLIVRSAILGFLAFAFARPFIHEQNIPFVAEAQEKSTVVLIDGSYSMQYGSRFNTARTEALKRIRSAGPTDEISIVVFSDEASQLSELSQDIQLHANVVENGINVTNRGTDFYKPLKLAEDILKNAKNEVREILLFSDMQSNGWTRQFENWKIDPTIHFIPVKITEDHEINSYINAFDLKQKRRGETVIAQYGLQIITTGEDDLSTEVSLWVNNHQVETQHRDRKDFDQMVFQQQGLKEGIYQGYLALDKDDLFIDNFHYFSLTVESQPFILCIDPSYQSIKSNAFYLQNCFDLGDESLYRFQSASTNRITSGGLSDYDVLFLTNVNAFSDQQVALLKSYVNRGGNIILSFGDRIDLERYSDNLNAFGIGTLSEKVLVRSMQSSNAIIGEVDMKHPIFTIFTQTGTGDMFKPEFREYVKLVPDSTAQVLGRYDTGDPFLIERAYGRGKMLTMTSSFNTEWSDFPVNEIYLPFVYQLVKHVISSETSKNSFTVGEAISFTGESGDQWEVRAPDDKIFKVQIEDNGRGYLRETEIPGNYRAVHADQEFCFSVNVDTKESDLTSRDPEAFYASVTQPASRIQNESYRASMEEMKDTENRQKLWRMIMVLILLLFVFETFYANRKNKQQATHVEAIPVKKK